MTKQNRRQNSWRSAELRSWEFSTHCEISWVGLSELTTIWSAKVCQIQFQVTKSHAHYELSHRWDGLTLSPKYNNIIHIITVTWMNYFWQSQIKTSIDSISHYVLAIIILKNCSLFAKLLLIVKWRKYTGSNYSACTSNFAPSQIEKIKNKKRTKVASQTHRRPFCSVGIYLQTHLNLI